MISSKGKYYLHQQIEQSKRNWAVFRMHEEVDEMRGKGQKEKVEQGSGGTVFDKELQIAKEEPTGCRVFYST